MAFLQHCLNGALVAHYVVDPALRLGRAADNDIVLEDGTVSGHHAEIHLGEQGQFLFKDLGSTNGVSLDGKKLAQGQLDEGQWLTVGLHEFTRIEQLPAGMEQTLKIKKSWIPGVYYTAEK
ncbi:FHA domain-containing protein [Simiduia aestuariiviva]|uniref:PSer/pThr/pTyr-binding forkhead associated (FHA) protein n=1 Tax=Simiduia aestuariiviva TaxID=1510459 RepID=A0A839UIS0_9GAMM|nr:FHA domain-containing protein [Simiduia aestuariiviva]MBB3167984.1 pSer/pThr/pTyr-binding forkhead associated (FHA) protein [Simiduia aestuariiviva]